MQVNLPPDTTSENGLSGPHLAQMFDTHPNHGEVIEIADGIWWVRIELSGVPSHVNVYILRGSTGWILVDTGNNTPDSREAIERVFQSPTFCNAPLQYVIVTHFHPEHIGLAGVLCGPKTKLICTRSCWATTKLLCIPSAGDRRPEQVEFMKLAGLAGIDLEAFFRSGNRKFREVVAPLPDSFFNIGQGDILKIGGRKWAVEIGHGHAADHVTLWSDDQFLISGDQILPGISSNLSVPPSEPDSDTVAQWIDSCVRLGALSSPETKCLPGHNMPFTGVARRCEQLKENHIKAIDRLLNHLTIPRKAVDCLQAVYRRDLAPNERGTLIAETVGYLNHLRNRGCVQRQLVNNAYIWSRISSAADDPINTNASFEAKKVFCI
ncbi:MAG TPA: MBL fold hydrolase [Planctomycetaceae bacterium]|nr:MBL fold hydrolase [Planctomycetaceae bacterium]